MIDLHAHTTISDGTLTPRELVSLGKSLGLKALAITDHDSIDGHIEAQQEADKVGLNLVKGIEFSVSNGEDRLIHILGLGLDTTSNIFMNIYNNYRKIRSEKLDYVFTELQKMGLNITRNDVKPFTVGGFMDRQAIGKYLVFKGYVPIIKNAWIDYLDHIPYIPGELIIPKEAFKAIHAAGGKAFMAHFHLPIGLKGYTDKEAREKLKDLKELGLDGLEYYYPSFTKEDSLRCKKYIDDFDFLMSGGTDFHGKNREHIKLGIGEGSFKVPDNILKNIY